ncbi:MAG: metalloregulator ArsR/SmtB family transcription factor [Chthoniobacteraceae bacterium]
MASAKSPTPLSTAQLDDIAALFKMLGEPMRLRILQAVCKAPRSVSEIVDAAESTQANVSKHLALLTAAGILRRERDGQRVFYSVKEPLVMRLCETVRESWLE